MGKEPCTTRYTYKLIDYANVICEPAFRKGCRTQNTETTLRRAARPNEDSFEGPVGLPLA